MRTEGTNEWNLLNSFQILENRNWIKQGESRSLEKENKHIELFLRILAYIIIIIIMLSYKYYLNTVTRTVSKDTVTVLSCYHINITLTVTRTVDLFFVIFFHSVPKLMGIHLSGSLFPRNLSKQTPIKWTLKIMCVQVVKLASGVFLIHSIFPF